jgi:hypothetical protein
MSDSSTPTAISATRGERNNNPGNINYVAPPEEAWNGQVGLEIVPTGENYMPRFGRYDTPEHGIRAMAKQLIIDNTRHGLMTIATIIGDPVWGWAPAADRNDIDAYAATVVKHSSIPADQPVDLTNPAQLQALLPGFITEENGRCLYAAATLSAAVNAALS